MFEYYVLAWRRAFEFNGCSNCSEFWIYFVFSNVFTISSIFVVNKITGRFEVSQFTQLIAVIHIPALISVGVRRLHDINKTGWLLLVTFIPFGQPYLLYLFTRPSDKGANRFGSPSVHEVSVVEPSVPVEEPTEKSDQLIHKGIEKLEQLAKLHATGVIDADDYERVRLKIIEIMNRAA